MLLLDRFLLFTQAPANCSRKINLYYLYVVLLAYLCSIEVTFPLLRLHYFYSFTCLVPQISIFFDFIFGKAAFDCHLNPLYDHEKEDQNIEDYVAESDI